MNRIIIIGNGFDLAHNLKTGYRDFIDNYWTVVGERVYSKYWRLIDQQYGMNHALSDYKDKFVSIETIYGQRDAKKESFSYKEDNPFVDLCVLIDRYNNLDTTVSVCLKFKNHFFELISKQCSLTNWVDIENEYYNILKELLREKNTQKQNESIRTLNKEFDDVKELLENYLIKVLKNTEIEKYQSIQDAFSSYVEFDEIAICKRTEYSNSIFSTMNTNGDSDFGEDQEKDLEYNVCNTNYEKQMHFIEKRVKSESFKEYYLKPNTLILNFNYTKTAEKLYFDNVDVEIINVHGELNNNNNPIIFGYGDELDDDYKNIERLQNNHFLENIKSIRYHETTNYRNLLKYIAMGPYQVFVMGHSCGNSDRTLLNTLFEHNNCMSIKVFYHEFYKNTESYDEISDNYVDLIKNISRNFNDKPRMRDIVVNRERCFPLVPVKKEPVV